MTKQKRLTKEFEIEAVRLAGASGRTHRRTRKNHVTSQMQGRSIKVSLDYGR